MRIISEENHTKQCAPSRRTLPKFLIKSDIDTDDYVAPVSMEATISGRLNPPINFTHLHIHTHTYHVNNFRIKAFMGVGKIRLCISRGTIRAFVHCNVTSIGKFVIYEKQLTDCVMIDIILTRWTLTCKKREKVIILVV